MELIRGFLQGFGIGIGLLVAMLLILFARAHGCPL